jgi:hypothetical protein
LRWIVTAPASEFYFRSPPFYLRQIQKKLQNKKSYLQRSN